MVVLSTYDNRVLPADKNVARVRIAPEFKSPDLLIVGNSYAYSSFHPEVLRDAGFRSFNLGFPAAGPESVGLIMRDYLHQADGPPHAVLWAVSPLIFHKKSDRFEDYPVHRYLGDPLSNEELVLTVRNWDLASRYPLLLQRGAARGWRALFGDPSAFSKVASSVRRDCGFFASEQVYSDAVREATERLMKPLGTQRAIAPAVRIRFMELVGELEGAGIHLVFVEPPSHRLYDYLAPTLVADYRDILESLRARGFPVLVDVPVTDPACFRNLDHMNTRGAREFTRRLVLRHGAVLRAGRSEERISGETTNTGALL